MASHWSCKQILRVHARFFCAFLAHSSQRINPSDRISFGPNNAVQASAKDEGLLAGIRLRGQLATNGSSWREASRFQGFKFNQAQSPPQEAATVLSSPPRAADRRQRREILSAPAAPRATTAEKNILETAPADHQLLSSAGAYQ